MLPYLGQDQISVEVAEQEMKEKIKVKYLIIPPLSGN